MTNPMDKMTDKQKKEYKFELFIDQHAILESHLMRTHVIQFNIYRNFEIGQSVDDHIEKDIFRCRVCKYGCQDPMKFKRHMKKEYKKYLKAPKCPECGELTVKPKICINCFDKKVVVHNRDKLEIWQAGRGTIQ